MNSFFSEIVKDHDKVKSILEEIEKLDEGEAKNREKLLIKLKKELIPHSRAEEQLLYYNMLDEDRDTKVLGLEGYQEHHVVDLLFEELENDEVDSPLWDAKFCVLKDTVLHHIREEESEIFDAFEKSGKRDFDALTEEFLELKKRMKNLPTQIDVGTTPEQAANMEIRA